MSKVTETAEVEPTAIQAEPIRLQREGGVTVVYLNRPEKGNAWSSELGRAYFSTMEKLATDAETRVIVVTGSGNNFCVGADPTLLGKIAANGEHHSQRVSAVPEKPYYFPLTIGKPIIAAVNGACFGIGLQQLLCSDLRFLADDCKLSTAYARRGLVAELGMSWLLPRIIGNGRAMDWMLSARVVRAQEALEAGLANGVFPADKLLHEVIGYARILAEKCSPLSMREIKQQLIQDATSSLPEAVQRSSELLDAAYAYPDFKEGVTSWREGREPAFSSLPETKAFLTVNPLNYQFNYGKSDDDR